jgi:NADH-quinone oxidoreductase subunit M
MGGLALRAPVLAAIFLIVVLATLAMPGSANFVGEFLILTGTLNSKIVFAVIASAGVVLSAVYAIRLFQRSMHNPLGANAHSREMTFVDGLAIVPVVAVIVVLALYPQLILKRSDASVSQSVQATQSSNLEARR